MPESIVRKIYIRKTDVAEFGETPGCIRCRCAVLGKPLQSHTVACRERIEGRLRETEEGRQRSSKADDRVTEALVRESERIMRATSRDDSERTSRGGEPPSVVRESTTEPAPSADDGSRPPPPRQVQLASTGRGGGSAETRRSQRGKKRAVSGELKESDQRESISRRLPEETRGHKRASDRDREVEDQRESISRRLPDEDERPVPAGIPQPFSPDSAAAAMRSEKKRIQKLRSSRHRQLGEVPREIWPWFEQSLVASMMCRSSTARPEVSRWLGSLP